MEKAGVDAEMDRLRLRSGLGKIRLDVWNDKKIILDIHSNIMEKYSFNMKLYHDMKTSLDSYLMTKGGGTDVSCIQNRLNEMEEEDIPKIHLGIADLGMKCMERGSLMEEAWNVTVFPEELDSMTEKKIKDLLKKFVTDQRVLKYNEHQAAHDLNGIWRELETAMLTCLHKLAVLSDNFYKVQMREVEAGNN